MPSADLLPDRSPRQEPRKNLFLTATLVTGGVNRAVRVRNLSATGALVEATGLSAIGGTASLQRGSLNVECVLVWQADGRGGLRFANPIDLAEWIPGARAGGQMQVDRAIAAARADLAAIVPPAVDDGGASDEIASRLMLRTAEELAFVSRRLEALGNDLTNDTHVVMRHGASLQELDISMQILGHIARLLAADRPEEMVKSIGMTDLRRRLQRNSSI
jgi:hypothetical protein